MEKLDIIQISGFITLVVLLGLLVFNVVKGKNIRPLLYFFIVPVMLLGWSSIVKFSLNKDGLTVEKKLEKTVEDYAKNPTDENKAKVEKTIDDVKKQEDVSPKLLEIQAEAEHIIGRNDDAKQTIAKAEEKYSLSNQGLEFKQNIILTDKLDEKIKFAEQLPNKQNLDSLKIYRADAFKLAYKSPILQERLMKTDKLLNQ